MRVRRRRAAAVVFDTNVLISHCWGSATIDRIMRAMRDGVFVPVTSRDILDEYAAVAAMPKIRERIDPQLIRRLERDLVTFGRLVYPKRRVVVCRDDPTDNHVLECACEGNADYAVTGDPHLLNLRRFENTRIMSPADFLRTVLPRRYR